MDTEIETPEVEAPKKPRGRPRKTVVTAPQFSDEQFDRLMAILATNRSEGAGIAKTDLAEILKESAIASAKTMQRAMRPENEEAPGVTALSYREGDRLHPRPVLPYELWWNGYPMHMFPETEHWRELELACQIRAGEFPILRKDGTKNVVTVKADKNPDGIVTRLELTFPETREDKWLTPPKMVTLYQIVNSGEKSPRQVFMEAMNEYYTIMFGGEATAA